mgnify:CR=1 FL=1
MLQQVKDYLKITWDDEDAEISRMIDRGKAHINDLVGAELEYEVVTSANEAYETALADVIEAVKREEDPITTGEAITLILAAEESRDSAVVKPTPAVSLLLDYCRYAYNNASEYFEENFQKEILRLQLKTGVSLLPVKGEEDEV